MWSVKWGPEASASVFSTHYAAAVGYIVETEYFVPKGRIAGVHDLKRAKDFVLTGGAFANARFQLRAKSPKFMKDHNWAWTNNPFIGTREFNGLRILMMLLSNWDAKDARDLNPDAHSKFADSNLAIFETTGSRPKYLYFVSDWGCTLGKYSLIPGMRDPWDPKEYARQSPEFVKGVRDGVIDWGFAGTHGADLTSGITIDDVRWLLPHLRRISDAQIRRGLMASGASPEEAASFAHSLRERIAQLVRVAAAGPAIEARR